MFRKHFVGSLLLVIEPGVPNPFLHGRPNPFRDEEDAKRIREFIAQARGILTF